MKDELSKAGYAWRTGYKKLLKRQREIFNLQVIKIWELKANLPFQWPSFNTNDIVKGYNNLLEPAITVSFHIYWMWVIRSITEYKRSLFLKSELTSL